MIEQKTSNATLEIAGPRRASWRPAGFTGYLARSVKLAETGRYQEALWVADDEYQQYCETEGIDRNLNQVHFRVRVVSETLIGLWNAEKLHEVPGEAASTGEPA